MSFITATRIAGSETTVTIEITARADAESPGIRRVEVLDNRRESLDVREGSCERYFFFVLPDVVRTRLPIFIVATECEVPGQSIPGSSIVVGPLLNEERDDPSATVRCLPTIVNMPNVNNAACIERQAEVQRKRDEIRRLCSEADNLRRQRDESAAVAAVAYAATAALAAAAGGASTIPIFGQIAALILLVAAAIALLIAISASIAAAVFSAQLGEKLGEVRRAQAEHSDLIAQVLRVCCPEFITVSLDAPGCG